jgi:hypothetical protein
VFDLDQTSRLKVWKEFRQSLESSEQPLEDVVLFWSRAPFVSRYLDPNNPSKWPDPWHLILDNRYDDLAIALGMCYTLTLTDRFKSQKVEIHTSMFTGEGRNIVVVNDRDVLNLFHREVTNVGELTHGSNKIWPV